jgi:hypothetical protein
MWARFNLEITVNNALHACISRKSWKKRANMRADCGRGQTNRAGARECIRTRGVRERVRSTSALRTLSCQFLDWRRRSDERVYWCIQHSASCKSQLLLQLARFRWKATSALAAAVEFHACAGSGQAVLCWSAQIWPNTSRSSFLHSSRRRS